MLVNVKGGRLMNTWPNGYTLCEQDYSRRVTSCTAYTIVPHEQVGSGNYYW
jgi:hypothetical protein